jgi:hypothetical protein
MENNDKKNIIIIIILIIVSVTIIAYEQCCNQPATFSQLLSFLIYIIAD